MITFLALFLLAQDPDFTRDQLIDAHGTLRVHYDYRQRQWALEARNGLTPAEACRQADWVDRQLTPVRRTLDQGWFYAGGRHDLTPGERDTLRDIERDLELDLARYERRCRH